MPRLKNALKVARAYIQMATHAVPGDVPDLCRLIQQCTLQVPSEMLQLAELIRSKNIRNGMEIGTWRGGTLFLLCHFGQPDAVIVSLDMPGGLFGGGYHWLQIPVYRMFARGNQKLHLLRQDSHSDESQRIVEEILGGNKLDYLLIDGDHTYEGVKKDFEMYSPAVSDHGVIVFHDIVPHAPERNCGVSDFWREIRPKYEHREFVESWQQQWAGIGVLFPRGRSVDTTHAH
jgi:predicted O-methyltransferase YrrM